MRQAATMALALALVAGAVALGALTDWRYGLGDEGTDPTPVRVLPPPVEREPVLTGGEAAAKAEAHFRADLDVSLAVSCDAEEYVVRWPRRWVVQCRFAGPGGSRDLRFYVSDPGGVVTTIQ